MTGANTERQVAAIEDACANATDAAELFAEVSARLRRSLGFDGAAWFVTDPGTVLATAPAQVENVTDGQCESYWEREFTVPDALLFRDLARAERPLGTLYESTDDHPERSARYREFLNPQGYGDELRAALRSGASTWGVVDLFRDRDRRAFTGADVEFMQAVTPAIASALRAFATSAPRAGAFDADHADGPGTAIFDDYGVVVSLDENAERWFTELAGPHWASAPIAMNPIFAAVAVAPAVFAGRERGPAATRVRTPTGRWLSVHASCLRRPDGSAGQVAVTIEPAKSAQIAPIIVEAYCLTPREQQITQALARGLSNVEIAAELYLSAHTVRDHLKAIFAKVGVGSRGELVAKLFADHYGVALHAPDAKVSHLAV